MEDNVTFKNDIKKLVHYYIDQAKELNWDIIFEGDTPSLKYKEDKIRKDKMLYKKSNEQLFGLGGSTRCSNFYILNLKAAQKYYESFTPFENVCDHWSNHLFRKLNFNVYWVIPPQVHRIMTHPRVSISG